MAGTYTMSCPTCGVPMPTAGTGQGFAFGPGYPAGYGPAFSFPTPMYGWGPGAFPQGLPAPGGWAGPGFPTDEQITQMIYDTIDADPAVPYDTDLTVDVTGGVVTLTGTVPNKRVKHAVGDDAWWVPGVWDINNNLEITPRARRPERTEELRPS